MKEYIGDSVYAELNQYQQIELTTDNNGYGPTNTIFLELEVMRALVAFWNKVHGNPPVDESKAWVPRITFKCSNGHTYHSSIEEAMVCDAMR